MFKKIFKLNILILIPALLAGIIFLCGFAAVVPDGVTVNGVAVGGKPYTRAAAEVREKIASGLDGKTLEIVGGQEVYTFSYPEISFKDDLYKTLKSARRGDTLTASVSYYLCGLDEIARYICANESVSPVEPYAVFNRRGDPFTYCEGRDGRKADGEKLKKDIMYSLSGGFEKVNISFTGVPRAKSMDEVRSQTKKLASFTTNFDGSNFNRSSNIRLAANYLSGTVLASGKTLSFNDIVGARVVSRGFLPAKIIENGVFTDGVGGGVCQVSTTLYNAALLAGLKIEEFHPHTLAVGYVPPSRDAMVSGDYYDLKISNPTDCPVYIRALTGKNSVTFEVYGKKGDAEYSLSSSVTGHIEAEEEITDDPAKVRAKKDGLKSEGYLTVTRGGYKKTVLLRKDKYLPVKGLKYEEEETEETPPAEISSP